MINNNHNNTNNNTHIEPQSISSGSSNSIAIATTTMMKSLRRAFSLTASTLNPSSSSFRIVPMMMENLEHHDNNDDEDHVIPTDCDVTANRISIINSSHQQQRITPTSSNHRTLRNSVDTSILSYMQSNDSSSLQLTPTSTSFGQPLQMMNTAAFLSAKTKSGLSKEDEEKEKQPQPNQQKLVEHHSSSKKEEVQKEEEEEEEEISPPYQEWNLHSYEEPNQGMNLTYGYLPHHNHNNYNNNNNNDDDDTNPSQQPIDYLSMIISQPMIISQQYQETSPDQQLEVNSLPSSSVTSFNS
jgi:hypothetical protein